MNDQSKTEEKQEDKHLAPFEYRGTHRILKIKPCTITLDDLRKLYTQLDKKTSEALEVYLDTLKSNPNDDPKQLEKLKSEAREIGGLTIIITAKNGEQVVDTNIDALTDNEIPDDIVRIKFDSSAALQGYNVNLINRFALVLDFAETPGFNFYNPWNQRTPNDSNMEVLGADTSWVSGVYETVQTFIDRKKRSVEWLHSAVTFNLLNWIFAFPAALWIAYRIDTSFQDILQNIHVVIRGALYVYLILISLLVFRVLMHITRWIFPVVELHEARSFGVRAFLGVIVVSILGSVIYDILKTIF